MIAYVADMRLLHTSDWHLGQELHGVDRIVEQSRLLDQVLQIAVTHSVDALLLSGDVYHTVNPSVRAQKVLYGALARLAREAPGLQVAIIAGNHDSPARLELPLSLPLDFGADGAGGVDVVGAPSRRDGRLDPSACARLLRKRDGTPGATAALIPFLRPSDLPSVETATAFVAEATAAARALGAAAGAPDLPQVVAAHLHVSGAQASPDSERPILVGGLDAAPLSIFPDEIDYVALGHIHRAQTLRDGPSVVRYAGSLGPLSATERSYRHSVTVVDLGDGPPRWREVPLTRPRPFLRVPDTGAAPIVDIEHALAALAADPPAVDDPELTPFLDVALRLDGPEPPTELRARLEAALGDAPIRLLRIHRESAAGDGAPGAPQLDLSDLDPETAFRELHRRQHGADPAPELAHAFRTLLAEDAQQ